jgi:hypothetical protein
MQDVQDQMLCVSADWSALLGSTGREGGLYDSAPTHSPARPAADRGFRAARPNDSPGRRFDWIHTDPTDLKSRWWSLVSSSAEAAGLIRLPRDLAEDDPNLVRCAVVD